MLWPLRDRNASPLTKSPVSKVLVVGRAVGLDPLRCREFVCKRKLDGQSVQGMASSRQNTDCQSGAELSF